MNTLVSTNTLLTSDGERISYRHYKKGYDKIIIIAHGFYNSKDSVLLQRMAQELLREYDVFMFDFRGHGQSSGLFYWTSKEDDDLRKVCEYIGESYKKIGLIGFSFGGSIGINVLSRVDMVDSFVCVSAPSDLRKIDYRFWELNWENDVVYSLFREEGRKGKGMRPGPFWLKKDKPIESVNRVRAPILYIHGNKDWVVRPWHSQALYDETCAKKKIVTIEDGLHAEYLMRKQPEKFMSVIKDWFHETLGNGE